MKIISSQLKLFTFIYVPVFFKYKKIRLVVVNLLILFISFGIYFYFIPEDFSYYLKTAFYQRYTPSVNLAGVLYLIQISPFFLRLLTILIIVFCLLLTVKSHEDQFYSLMQIWTLSILLVYTVKVCIAL